MKTEDQVKERYNKIIKALIDSLDGEIISIVDLNSKQELKGFIKGLEWVLGYGQKK